ncbi:MAG: hypothetical protein ACOX5J_09065 [Candidatus Hydrogenedentales bacterium]|jgi:MFS superfamily sulfate permease-like transporter
MRGFLTAVVYGLVLGCCLFVQGAARPDAANASPKERAAVAA